MRWYWLDHMKLKIISHFIPFLSNCLYFRNLYYWYWPLGRVPTWLMWHRKKWQGGCWGSSEWCTSYGEMSKHGFGEWEMFTAPPIQPLALRVWLCHEKNLSSEGRVRRWLMEVGCQQRTKSQIVRGLQWCWIWAGVWAWIVCISDRTCSTRTGRWLYWSHIPITRLTSEGWAGWEGIRCLVSWSKWWVSECKRAILGQNGHVAVPKYKHLGANNVTVSHKSSWKQFERSSGQLLL